MGTYLWIEQPFVRWSKQVASYRSSPMPAMIEASAAE
jgi:hypothetical protein